MTLGAAVDGGQLRTGVLLDLAMGIAQSPDVSAGLSEIVRKARWLIDFDRCTVALPSPGSPGQFILRVLFDRGGSCPPDEPMSPGEGRLARAIETGAPAVTSSETGSTLCVPMVAGGSRAGAIEFECAQVGSYDHGHVQAARVFATQLGAAVLREARVAALESAHCALVDEVARCQQMEVELRLAQKLEAVGQLAAGIAHEINTPTQYVGDSIHFLSEAFEDLLGVLGAWEATRPALGTAGSELLEAVDEAADIADLDYLRERIPAACERARDGVERVSTIVRAMKEFAHPGGGELSRADLNAALRSTATVARNEYKYVAELELALGEIPPLQCCLGDINQVFLNLLVNAAHATADAMPPDGSLGRIRVSSHVDGADAVVRVADDGPGIPPDLVDRVFDPFFTTKEVGKGTGQGLAIARSVVDRHGGRISVDTEAGRGTTFEVRLPIDGPPEEAVS